MLIKSQVPWYIGVKHLIQKKMAKQQTSLTVSPHIRLYNQECKWTAVLNEELFFYIPDYGHECAPKLSKILMFSLFISV